jgi:hypothetical protein
VPTRSPTAWAFSLPGRTAKGHPTEEAVKNASRLKTAKSLGLGKRIHGFFTLEWELVEAFHKNGFLWGVTFTGRKGRGGHVDLHHFEL